MKYNEGWGNAFISANWFSPGYKPLEYSTSFLTSRLSLGPSTSFGYNKRVEVLPDHNSQ